MWRLHGFSFNCVFMFLKKCSVTGGLPYTPTDRHWQDAPPSVVVEVSTLFLTSRDPKTPPMRWCPSRVQKLMLFTITPGTTTVLWRLQEAEFSYPTTWELPKIYDNTARAFKSKTKTSFVTRAFKIQRLASESGAYSESTEGPQWRRKLHFLATFTIQIPLLKVFQRQNLYFHQPCFSRLLLIQEDNILHWSLQSGRKVSVLTTKK